MESSIMWPILQKKKFTWLQIGSYISETDKPKIDALLCSQGDSCALLLDPDQLLNESSSSVCCQ